MLITEVFQDVEYNFPGSSSFNVFCQAICWYSYCSVLASHLTFLSCSLPHTLFIPRFECFYFNILQRLSFLILFTSCFIDLLYLDIHLLMFRKFSFVVLLKFSFLLPLECLASMLINCRICFHDTLEHFQCPFFFTVLNISLAVPDQIVLLCLLSMTVFGTIQSVAEIFPWGFK